MMVVRALTSFSGTTVIPRLVRAARLDKYEMRDRIVRIQIVPSLYLESKSKDQLLVRIQYRASVVQLQVRKNQIIATLKYLYLGFVRYIWVHTLIEEKLYQYKYCMHA